MNLDNTVIKAENQTHAKKIVKWFESQGADASFFDGDDYFPNERADSHYLLYYGIINGEFEYWDHDMVKRRKAKIIELPEETINEPILNVIL